MADSAAAIRNGFQAAFGPVIVIMCWFHMKKCVRKKINEIEMAINESVYSRRSINYNCLGVLRFSKRHPNCYNPNGPRKDLPYSYTTWRGSGSRQTVTGMRVWRSAALLQIMHLNSSTMKLSEKQRWGSDFHWGDFWRFWRKTFKSGQQEWTFQRRQ